MRSLLLLAQVDHQKKKTHRTQPQIKPPQNFVFSSSKFQPHRQTVINIHSVYQIRKQTNDTLIATHIIGENIVIGKILLRLPRM